MSNDLILAIKEKKFICKNCKKEISFPNPEQQEHFKLMGLVMDKNGQIEENIPQNNENNLLLDAEEDNAKKRYNSSDPKKVRDNDDIDDYFLKGINLLEWLYRNIDVSTKINEEILVLLKQIFDKRYKLYPNNVCSLSEYSTHIKTKVDMYCNEDNSMSTYILHVLYNKFFDLFKYMDDIINFEEMNSTDFNRFKEIIYLIGKDIKTIFKSAVNTIDEFADFKFSNVLTNMFNEFLIQEKKFEGVEMKHAALIAERKIFENFIKNVGMIEYTNNLRKWANDSSDDIMEAKIIKKYKENKNNENNIYNDENKNYYNIENIKFTEHKPGSEIKKSNNDINYISKDDNENDNDNNSLILEKEYDNNDVLKLNIEDLVTYINEPKAKTNHKKKPKKKKKSKKICKEIKENENNISNNNNNNIKEDNFGNNNVDEDLVIADFKKCIENFTIRNNNYLYPKKIEPNISGAFISKLKMYYE